MIFELYFLGFAVCLVVLKLHNVVYEKLDRMNIKIALFISLGSWISVIIMCIVFMIYFIKESSKSVLFNKIYTRLNNMFVGR